MRQYVPSHSMIDVTANGFQHDADVYVLSQDIPRWIPVTEQLPEPGETVLVWHHGEVQMAWLNYLTNGVAYFVRDTHYNFEPTHWMPLPTPPGN